MEKKYKVQNISGNEAKVELIDESSHVDIETSLDNWMAGDDSVFDMEASSSMSNTPSLSTTRAPSPSNDEFSKTEVTSPTAMTSSLVTGRSKRSVKRPPKRFDD